MELPKMVAKQVEEANALMGIGKNQEPTSDVDEQQKPHVEESTTSNEGIDEKVVQQSEIQELEEEGEKPVEDLINEWEHKYKVLQGKYNKEISDLMHETQYLKSQIEALQRLMQQQKEEKIEPQVDSEEEEFKKEFPDIYNMMNKIVNKKLSEVEQLKNTVQAVSQHATRSIEEKFYETLDAEVPDWRIINASPEFLKWLQEKDDYSPYTRYDNLLAATSIWDARTVVNVLKKYKESIGGSNPEQEIPVKRDVSKFVSPSTTQKPRKEQVSSTEVKRTISKDEINKFYQDLALGRLKLSPEEKQRKEQEIWSAIAEGRVV